MVPRFLYNGRVMQRLQSGKSYFFKDADSAIKISEELPVIDRLVVSAESLVVKELRGLILQLQETPYGEVRIFTLLRADLLSTVLQNTLLKLVEEPPPSLIVVLQTNLPNRLLPTLRSRLHSITDAVKSRSGEESVGKLEIDVSTLMTVDKTKLIPKLREISEWLLGQEGSSTKLSLVSDTIRRLELRCNSKLTIDRFLLHWKLLSGIE